MVARSHFEVESSLLQLGAVNSLVGTLTARTLMFAEIETLMATSCGGVSDYRELVVEENVCGKQTYSTRQKTYRHLRELYALDGDVGLFILWKKLWCAAEEEQRMLAMLLAASREPLLRITAPVVLNSLPGAPVTAADFEQELAQALPDHYSKKTLRSLGQNCASAWAQSGHLKGRVNKVRTKASAGPASTAFALYLAHEGGAVGMATFDTLWVRLLDASSATLDQMAFTAASRGWMDYRRIGDVVDISFSEWNRVLDERREATRFRL